MAAPGLQTGAMTACPARRPRRRTVAVLFALLATALAACTCAAAEPAKPPSHAAVSAATLDVAARYFAAYVDRRWDDLAPLLGEQASFQDPTAERLFGSVRHQGREAILRLYREGYAAITAMHFVPMRRFASGAVAVFEGQLDWTLRLPDGRLIRSVAPMVTTLRVADGRVVEHVDLLDYQPFVDEVVRTRPAAASEPAR